MINIYPKLLNKPNTTFIKGCYLHGICEDKAGCEIMTDRITADVVPTEKGIYDAIVHYEYDDGTTEDVQAKFLFWFTHVFGTETKGLIVAVDDDENMVYALEMYDKEECDL